jgi:hypothetical protein
MTSSNSGRQLVGAIRWLILALIPGVAIFALVSVPPPLTIGDIPTATLEPTLLALGRLAGLVVSGWLLASQVLYTLAVVTRTHWLTEVLRPITLPLVRRIAAGLATVTISLSTVTAVTQAPTEATVVAIDYSNLRQEATPTPNLQPLVEVETEEPCLADEPIGSYSAPLTWLVRPGDHLWKIAGEHLTIVLDRPPTRNEHARYWVEIVNAARAVIRSGDPNLIYPGEQIPLPATLDAGVRP